MHMSTTSTLMSSEMPLFSRHFTRTVFARSCENVRSEATSEASRLEKEEEEEEEEEEEMVI